MWRAPGLKNPPAFMAQMTPSYFDLRGLRTGIISLSIEEHSSQQIIKIAGIGRLGDLRIGGRQGFIHLLLRHVGVHEAA